MDKKTIILLLATVVVIVGVGITIYILTSKTSTLVRPQTSVSKTVTGAVPSKDLKSYADPSGFSFDYPDNLSLTNNESEDPNSYADITLTSTDVGGSLNLKIIDSKLKTNDAWLKTLKTTSASKEVTFGNLKALEVETEGKVLLGALDQGILFTIEVDLSDKPDFWREVYSKVITDFSFAPPAPVETEASSGSASDISFEGEEVVD